MRSDIRHGAVSAFDEPRGLGTLIDDATGDEVPFHCTAIADGTRRIEVGAVVSYHLAAAHRGRYEARDLTPR